MANSATHRSLLKSDGGRTHETVGVNSPATDATALPSTTGDIRENVDPTTRALGLLGWVCTAGASPGPGTWQAVDLRTALAAVGAHVLLDRHVDTSLFPAGVALDLLGSGLLQQSVSGGIATLAARAMSPNTILYVDGGGAVKTSAGILDFTETSFGGNGAAHADYLSAGALFATGHLGLQGLSVVTLPAPGTYHDVAIADLACVIEYSGGSGDVFLGGFVPSAGLSTSPGSTGRVLFVRNSTAFAVFLIQEDTGSGVANRYDLNIPNGSAHRIAPGQMFGLIYANGRNRWVPLTTSVESIGNWIIGGEYAALGCPSTPSTPTGLGQSASETSNFYEFPIGDLVARGARWINMRSICRFFFAGGNPNDLGITIDGSIIDHVTVSAAGTLPSLTVAIPPGSSAAGLYTRNPLGTPWQIFVNTSWEFFR